ncbi:MAG TPA: hypothetical protein VFC47_12410 [Caulobacteraceae bacterium]|nr:hypothetical protein [Caulobacteraceae bacterium]
MKQLVSLTLTGIVLATAAAAQTSPRVVRGVVTQVRPDALVVRSRDGKPVTVALTASWSVSVMKPIGIDAIQPGSFIGTAEMPQADGTGKSLEVHIFPPGVKMGEGHYAWDLRPRSMMTNGTVGKVTAGRHGRELDVAYPNGTRHLTVPGNVPIVQIGGGDRAQVKPGVPVFMIVAPGAGGALTAGAVAIGEGGKAPPM